MWYYKLFEGNEDDRTSRYPYSIDVISIFASEDEQILGDFRNREGTLDFFERDDRIHWLGYLHTDGEKIIGYEQNDKVLLSLNDVKFIAKLANVYHSKLGMTELTLKLE